jgi:hypothetical protein
MLGKTVDLLGEPNLTIIEVQAFHGFTQIFQEIFGGTPQVHLDCFLPHNFEFIMKEQLSLCIIN